VLLAPTKLQETTLSGGADAFGDPTASATEAVVGEAQADPAPTVSCMNSAESSGWYQNGNAQAFGGSLLAVGHASMPPSGLAHMPASPTVSAESSSTPNPVFEVLPAALSPWQAPSSIADMSVPAAPTALPPWRAAKATHVAGVQVAEPASTQTGLACGIGCSAPTFLPSVGTLMEQPLALLATAGSSAHGVAPTWNGVQPSSLATTSPPQLWNIGGVPPQSNLLPPHCPSFLLPPIPLGPNPIASSDLHLPQSNLWLQQVPPLSVSSSHGAAVVENVALLPLPASLQSSAAADGLVPELRTGELLFHAPSNVAAADRCTSLGEVVLPLPLQVQPPFDACRAFQEPASSQENPAMKAAVLGTTEAGPCSLPDQKESQLPSIKRGTQELMGKVAVDTETENQGQLVACAMTVQEVDVLCHRSDSPKGNALQDMPCDAETRQDEDAKERGSEQQEAQPEHVGEKDRQALQVVAEEAHLEMASEEMAMHEQHHDVEQETAHQDSGSIRPALEEAVQQRTERERAEQEKADREKEVLELRVQKAMLQGELDALNKMWATQAKLGVEQCLSTMQSKRGDENAESVDRLGQTPEDNSAQEEHVLASEGILGRFLTSVLHQPPPSFWGMPAKVPSSTKTKEERRTEMNDEQEFHDSQFKRRRLSSFLGA